MAQTTAGRFDLKGKADETRQFEKGSVELFHIGGKTIGRATFQAGWKWSECLGPSAGTKTCQTTHLGYQISGTMHVRLDDGSEFDIRAGECFYLPPGHDGWVVGTEPVVMLDFIGMEDYAKPGPGAGGARPQRPGRKH